MDILQRISHWALERSDRPAYVYRGVTVTYRQLADDSDALAAWLAEFGCSSGGKIVVFGHMQPEMPVAFLACAKAGCAYIPVDDATPPERISSILRNADADCLLAISSMPEGIELGRTRAISDVSALIRSHLGRRPDPQRRVQADDTFYMIYTSGSTGEPKGVQIPLRCLQSFVDWMNCEANDSVGDSGEGGMYLNQAPYSFDLSVMDLYPAWSSGSTVWALDRSLLVRPAEMFAELTASNVTVWTSTPSFAEFCMQQPDFNKSMLPQLRMFRFCGEVLSPSCAKRLLARFPAAAVYNTYGPTEATVAVTSVRITNQLLEQYAELPVGRCKPDCRIVLKDERGSTLPEGEKGEIVIIGASVSPGYYGNPEATKHSFYFEEHPELGSVLAYRTGDSGYCCDGLLFYSGRLDFQVKLHGYRIELEEIEHRLRRLPGIKTAVVVPKLKEGRCDYLTAFVVPETMPKHEFDWSVDLKKQLAKALPAYMIPRRLVAKERLPVTINGKADRKRLAAELEV